MEQIMQKDYDAHDPSDEKRKACISYEMAKASGVTPSFFQRGELLLGSEAMERIARTRVIIFGVGGVGGWCAESLVRSGIRHLTIVDADSVSVSNCNRQIMATSRTVGRVKVEAMRDRLLEINPAADITALHQTYCSETKDSFHIEDYDYVIDAIDSLRDKIQLIHHVTHLSGPTLFSSMGAALRSDPFAVKCAEFWKVRNDTLGAIMRKRMRQRGIMPGKKFLCVYSDELPQPNRGTTDEECDYKAQINGTLCHVTAIFGFSLAGLVIQDLERLATP